MERRQRDIIQVIRDLDTEVRRLKATLTRSGGGGAAQLSDLSDVNTSTPTNRNVLVADGVDFESRALVEADIADFGSYAAAVHSHTESDISDLQAYLLDITGESIGDLSDVTVTAPATKHVVVYDGAGWVNRLLVEADISDLDSYLPIDGSGAMTGDLDLDGNDIEMGTLGSGGEIRLRSGYAVGASGGVGFKAVDHSGANADGLGLYGQDGVSVHVAQTEVARWSSSSLDFKKKDAVDVGDTTWRAASGRVWQFTMPPSGSNLPGVWSTSNSWEWLVGGSRAMYIDSNRKWHQPDIYTDTTGSAANAHVANGGRIYRSTSLLAHKSRITEKVDYLANIPLRPAKFYRKDDGRWRYGFIADWLAETDSLLGEYDDDGNLERFDTSATLAVLAAKVNRLERQVAGLSAA